MKLNVTSKRLVSQIFHSRETKHGFVPPSARSLKKSRTEKHHCYSFLRWRFCYHWLVVFLRFIQIQHSDSHLRSKLAAAALAAAAGDPVAGGRLDDGEFLVRLDSTGPKKAALVGG